MDITTLTSEITKVTRKIKIKDINYLVKEVSLRHKIYMTGEGRSGLVAKSFATRLARLEKSVYVVGSLAIPPIKKGDLMIAISGSGETKTVLETVKICRIMRGEVISLTAAADSALAKLSHKLILIPSQLPKRIGNVYQLRELIGVPERPALASIFELVALIVLEIAAFRLEKMWQRKNGKKRLLPS